MSESSTLPRNTKEPGFWRDLWQQFRLVIYLLRDPEVPFYLKLLPFAAVAYVMFPFDFIADFAPIIGQLDDVTALLVSSKVFIDLAPPEVVARHMKTIKEQNGRAGSGDVSAEDADVADAIIIDGQHEVVSKESGQ
ncbi:MAG: YkvA family protein [Anaerolineae bacterium]